METVIRSLKALVATLTTNVNDLTTEVLCLVEDLDVVKNSLNKERELVEHWENRYNQIAEKLEETTTQQKVIKLPHDQQMTICRKTLDEDYILKAAVQHWRDAGLKIQAIKAVRTVTGAGLKASKLAVDEVWGHQQENRVKAAERELADRYDEGDDGCPF
jgi:ribosomal protein L7/L12